MHDADVVIVGAGPAGGSAALSLAGSGLRVALLEQASLPRLKPCGGLMPRAVMERLGWDFSHLIKAQAGQLGFSHNHQHPSTRSLPPDALVLVDRAEFDHALIQEAVARADGRITVHQQCKVREILQDKQAVTVRCRGGRQLLGRALIGADGVKGVARRSCGLNVGAQTGLAIDADLRVSADLYERWNAGVEFNFFCIAKGYGWVFPKGPERLSVGLLSWSGTRGLKEALKRFMQQSFGSSELEVNAVHGYPIPEFGGNAELARGRVCLVGDAASLVDPVSGEGIRFALESGRLAAEQVASSLEGGDPGSLSKDYVTALQSPTSVFFALQHSQRFVRLAFNGSPEFFYKHHIVESKVPFYW